MRKVIKIKDIKNNLSNNKDYKFGTPIKVLGAIYSQVELKYDDRMYDVVVYDREVADNEILEEQLKGATKQ